ANTGCENSSDEVEVIESVAVKPKKETPRPKIVKGEDDDDESNRRSQWTDDERTELFEYLMGPDADTRFAKLKVNATKVFKTAAEELFMGKYKNRHEALKGQYERSLKIFSYILAYKGITGGGGDADEVNQSDQEDTREDLKERIEAARNRGSVVGSLSPAQLERWYKNGWFELFRTRHAKSPKIVRPVVRNSSSSLSDLDEVLNATESDGNNSDVLTPSKTSKKQIKTSKNKYRTSSSARQKTLASASGLQEYLTAKTKFDEARHKEQAMRSRVDIARGLISDASSSPEVKAAAEKLLLDFLLGN
ncbi:hypothetical protein C0992_007728, partial [Termitomyces sp. T32_za158]